MNYEIIALLADGDFHSGVELGRQLGLTRAAVWKNISRLSQLGLAVESVKGVGYRLTESLNLLSVPLIRQALDDEIANKVNELTIVPSLGSTNDSVKSKQFPRQGYTFCLAEHQTSGRGRRGKCWQSSFGKSLCLSMGFAFVADFSALNGLSLAVGIAVAKALDEFGFAAQLKWPNDVWVGKKKVAGILVEVDGEQGGPLNLVIGVGVNVNANEQEMMIDQPWTSLKIEQGSGIDRNALAARLITNLIQITHRFRQVGFAGLKEEWVKYDGLMGEQVVLGGHGSVEAGIYRGVDDNGYLLLASEGQVKSFAGGELSLRVAS